MSLYDYRYLGQSIIISRFLAWFENLSNIRLDRLETLILFSLEVKKYTSVFSFNFRKFGHIHSLISSVGLSSPEVPLMCAVWIRMKCNMNATSEIEKGCICKYERSKDGALRTHTCKYIILCITVCECSGTVIGFHLWLPVICLIFWTF